MRGGDGVIKGITTYAKRKINMIMSDGKARNTSEILDKLFEEKKDEQGRTPKLRYLPTNKELTSYMNKHYSKETRQETHPLALPGMRRKVSIIYYREGESVEAKE